MGESILPSVPAARLNRSQEKGKGLPAPCSLSSSPADKNSCPGAPGWRTERGERRERRRRTTGQSPGAVHLYGLRPEFGLVRGGGATGAGGQELVSEEKESGEEREWQDEADKGQCACFMAL